MNNLLKWSSTIQFVITIIILLSGYFTETLVSSMTLLCLFWTMEEFAKMCWEVYRNMSKR